MADILVKKIKTIDGDALIDYTALANKPDSKINASIKSLSVSGKTVTYTKNDGTTGTITTQDTTYSAATTSAAGLMSAADKSKLNGIASGANAYTLPTATDSVTGGVKLSDSTSSTSAASSGIAASPKAVKAAYDLASAANTAASTAQSTADAAMPKSGGTFTGKVYLQPWGGTSTKIGDANNTEIRYYADPNGHAVFAVFQNDTWVRTLFEADTNGTVYLSVLMPKSGGTFTGSVQAATGTTVNGGEIKNIRIVNQAYNAVLGGTRFIDFQRK